jgi:hypothetical protein
MNRRVHWRARGVGLDLKGVSDLGPRDVSPITAIARDLEALLSARLTGLGFSGVPRPGVRCYSAVFERHGADWLVTIEDERNTFTSQPRTVASA